MSEADDHLACLVELLQNGKKTSESEQTGKLRKIQPSVDENRGDELGIFYHFRPGRCQGLESSLSQPGYCVHPSG